MTRDGLLTLIGNTLAIMVAFALVWLGVGWLFAFMRRLLTTTPAAQPAHGPRSAAQPAAQDPHPACAGSPQAPDYGAWAAAQAAPSLDWLREFNDQPHIAPHVAVVGPSGSGKSTLVLAALSRRPGQLVITTTKSAQDDFWGGFPAVRTTFGADFTPSYTAIGAAWRAVHLEMNRRHADGGRLRTPITLVVDEFTTSLSKLRDLDPTQLFIDMWLTGRSVGIRLITMDPTMNVRGWGIEGRGDVRESILFVRTERAPHERAPRPAHFFEWNSARNVAFNVRAFDTSGVPALAAQGLDPARLWVPDAPVRATTPIAVHATAPAPAGDARFNAPTAPEPTVHEVALVQMWSEDGDPSLRQLARDLYRARGGDDPCYKGDGGPFYAVKAALAAVAAEPVVNA